MSDTTLATKPPVTGVGGWLRLLCILLTIISPIRILTDMAKGREQLAELFVLIPQLETASMVDGIMRVCVAFYSFYTGRQLWKQHHGAAANAKRYLLAVPILYALCAIPYLLLDLPAQWMRAILQDTATQTILLILMSSIWYSYLHRSRRVRNTFPEDFPRPDVPLDIT